MIVNPGHGVWDTAEILEACSHTVVIFIFRWETCAGREMIDRIIHHFTRLTATIMNKPISATIP